jgi:hypothetical protein
MHLLLTVPSLPLAELSRQPLFGNQWLALLAVLAGVALLMVVVAMTGRWLAATHPAAPPRPVAAPPTVDAGPSAEVLVVIAAAVAATFGRGARITGVAAVKPPAPSVEALMQQWSVEGRRQIYSSHQIR